MRCGRSAAAPSDRAAVLLVGLEVALEPRHLRVALEGEHVGGDAVEEPAVVGDHDRAAGERRAARPRARAACRRRGRWWARRAAAGCRRCAAAWRGARGCARRRRALPIRACWSEPLKLKPAVYWRELTSRSPTLIWSRPPEISSQTVFCGVERVARLVDVGELDRLAELERAAVGRLLAGDHPEQRRLAGAVGADHADDRRRAAARRTAPRSAGGRRSPCTASVAASTFSPRRGPAGMWIWTSSSLTLRSSATSSS